MVLFDLCILWVQQIQIQQMFTKDVFFKQTKNKQNIYLTLKAPIMTAADDSLEYCVIVFQGK